MRARSRPAGLAGKLALSFRSTGYSGHNTQHMGGSVGIYTDDDLVVICDDRHSDGCPFRWATSLSASPIGKSTSRQACNGPRPRGNGVGQASNQATEAGPDRRRRHNRVDKPRPVHPKRSKAIHESHGVVATTPILSASPGPATTNTYMRFRLRRDRGGPRIPTRRPSPPSHDRD